jgi:hypothetical protein
MAGSYCVAIFLMLPVVFSLNRIDGAGSNACAGAVESL